MEFESGHNKVKDKRFPPGMVNVSKWEWKPFSSKKVKYLPMVGQNLSRWEGEGEMFPSGKGYLCPQEKGEKFPSRSGKYFPYPQENFPLTFEKSTEIWQIYALFPGRVYVYGNDHPGKVCAIYVKYSPLPSIRKGRNEEIFLENGK